MEMANVAFLLTSSSLTAHVNGTLVFIPWWLLCYTFSWHTAFSIKRLEESEETQADWGILPAGRLLLRDWAKYTEMQRMSTDPHQEGRGVHPLASFLQILLLPKVILGPLDCTRFLMFDQSLSLLMPHLKPVLRILFSPNIIVSDVLWWWQSCVKMFLPLNPFYIELFFF